MAGEGGFDRGIGGGERIASDNHRGGVAVTVLDAYMVEPTLSLLEKTKIQAQVLVPVMQALRAELGKEKADALVKQALRDWSKQLFAAIGDGIDGSPKRKCATLHKAMGEVSAREVAFEMRRDDDEALEFDVTRCRFAEFFRGLGEPELGALLVCEADVDIAAAGAGAVGLELAQTIMKGAPSCTFRYKFAPR
jgi:predicted ArsR family transcriptional regulator